MGSFSDRLENLLKQDPTDLILKQKTTFEMLIAGTGERFVLFGSGRLGQITLAGLRKAGIEPLAFADNNSKLWGTKQQNLQVYSPESAAKKFGDNAVFVITVYTSAPVWEQLNGMGLKVMSFATLAWHYPQALTPHGSVELPQQIFSHADEVIKALNLWADDISRTEYLGQLAWRTSLDPKLLPPHLPQNDIYFDDAIFALLENEVFVDCGAFDGDSIREFINHCAGRFGEIVAIEPDPVNCKSLEAHIASLPPETSSRIRVFQSAVGSKHEMVTFNATGTAGSSVGEGRYQVQCASLDHLINNITPTFIKMDIEGAEPDALLGAKQIIANDAPILAVCLYHAQEHLWQIPLLIRSFSDKYDFFLRRYSDECWEIVCYAVPKTRLVT